MKVDISAHRLNFQELERWLLLGDPKSGYCSCTLTHLTPHTLKQIDEPTPTTNEIWRDYNTCVLEQTNYRKNLKYWLPFPYLSISLDLVSFGRRKSFAQSVCALVNEIYRTTKYWPQARKLCFSFGKIWVVYNSIAQKLIRKFWLKCNREDRKIFEMNGISWRRIQSFQPKSSCGK